MKEENAREVYWVGESEVKEPQEENRLENDDDQEDKSHTVL